MVGNVLMSSLGKPEFFLLLKEENRYGGTYKERCFLIIPGSTMDI